MADTDFELINTVRSFGQYRQLEIDDDEILTAINRAKSHLQFAVPNDEINWYDNPHAEEALFWTSMLFSKIVTGALDAKAISEGDIEESTLRAAGNVPTMWYSNYQQARNRLGQTNSIDRVGRSSRTADRDGTRRYTRNGN